MPNTREQTRFVKQPHTDTNGKVVDDPSTIVNCISLVVNQLREGCCFLSIGTTGKKLHLITGNILR